MEEKNVPPDENGSNYSTSVNQSPNKNYASRFESTNIQMSVSNSELMKPTTDINPKEPSSGMKCDSGSSASLLILEDFVSSEDLGDIQSSIKYFDDAAENISMPSRSEGFHLYSGRGSRNTTFDFELSNLSSRKPSPSDDCLSSAKGDSAVKIFDFPHPAFVCAKEKKVGQSPQKCRRDITNDVAIFLSNYALNNNPAEKNNDFGSSLKSKQVSSLSHFQMECSVSGNNSKDSNFDSITETQDVFNEEFLQDVEMIDNAEKHSTLQESAFLDVLKGVLDQLFLEIESIKPPEDVEDTKMFSESDDLDSKNNDVNFSANIEPFSECPGTNIEESPINIEGVNDTKSNSISEQNFDLFNYVTDQMNLKKSGHIPTTNSEGIVDNIVMYPPNEFCVDKNLSCYEFLNLNVNEPSAISEQIDTVNSSIVEECNITSVKITQPEEDCSSIKYSEDAQDSDFLLINHSKDSVLTKEYEQYLIDIGSPQAKYSSSIETTEISEQIAQKLFTKEYEEYLIDIGSPQAKYSSGIETTEISEQIAQKLSAKEYEQYLIDIGSPLAKYSTGIETIEISEQIARTKNSDDTAIIVTDEHETGSSPSKLSEYSEISKIYEQENGSSIAKYLRDSTTQIVNNGNNFFPTTPFEVFKKDISVFPSYSDNEAKYSSGIETTEISEQIARTKNSDDTAITVTDEHETDSSPSKLSEFTEISKIYEQVNGSSIAKYLRDSTTQIVNNGNDFFPRTPFEVFTKDISVLPSYSDNEVQNPSYIEGFEKSSTEVENTNFTNSGQLSNEPISFVFKFLLTDLEQSGNGFLGDGCTERTENIEKVDLKVMDVEKENAFKNSETETRGIKRKRYSPYASRKRFKAEISPERQESFGLLKAVPLILNRPRRLHKP